MNRERAVKIVVGVVGAIFAATIYPLIVYGRKDPTLAMMLSIYVTLGVFLLLALRNPSANRSLIAFAAWSSLAHAAVMGVQESLHMIAPGELVGVAIMAIIGVLLIVFMPA